MSSRIWEVVIVSLHPDSFKDLSSFIAWLPADQPDGKAGAAAALLANLAQVSGAALQVRKEKKRKEKKRKEKKRKEKKRKEKKRKEKKRKEKKRKEKKRLD